MKTGRRIGISIIMSCLGLLLYSMGCPTVSAAGKVSGLEQTGDSSTAVTVSWTDSSENHTYGVYSYDASGVQLGYQTVNGSQAEIGGFTPGSVVYIQVAQIGASGEVVADTMSDRLEAVTAPDASAGSILQTGQSESAITVSVNGVNGADSYCVIAYADGTDSQSGATQTYTGQEFSVPAAKNTVTQLLVYAQRVSASGYTAIDRAHPLSQTAYVKPSKIQKVGLGIWYPMVQPEGTAFPGYKANKVSVEWKNDFYSDGYSVVIYSLDGKKLKTYKVSAQTDDECKLDFVKTAVKNKGFIVKVQGYREINGKKCYGEYSDKKIIIPQASITKITGSDQKRTIYWKPVQNASQYVIYRVRDGKLKVVKTVGKKVTRYTVKGLKSGDGLAVAAKVEVKGKKYTSPLTWYISQE